MKILNQKRVLIYLLAPCILLCSCVIKNMGTSENSLNSNIEISENKVPVSKVLSKPKFKNSLHLIRNPKTNTYIIVNGEGTIVLKTMEPSIEQIGVAEDVDEGTNNYIYKTYTGEGLEEKTYGSGDSQFVSKDLTMRTVFYDRNGKEVGLTTNSYGASYTSKNKIIYRDNSAEYGKNDLVAFDVNTRETTVLPYSNLHTFNGQFLMSTNEYDEDSIANEVTVVCDGDFNELKRIEGYSVNSVQKKKGAYFLFLSKRIKDDSVQGGYVRKYNFANRDYKFLFDEDVDDVIWGDGMPIITIRKGDMVFDYDFSKLQKVSDDRPYVEEESTWSIMQDEKNKYDENRVKLQDQDDKYEYVSIFYHNGTVLYLAYEKAGYNVDDSVCDIYNEKLEKIASFDSLDNQYDEEGYLFVNKDTVYNDKLEIVKKFDTKCHLERIEKFGKTFFANSMALDYSSIKNFELYDKDFNLIVDKINAISSHTYKDYLVIADIDKTTLYDKDMNVVKVFDGRTIDIRGWYDSGSVYRMFEDLKNEREGIVGENFNIVVDNMKCIETLLDDYFTYQNGFKYGLMDYEGIPIFSYSVFDTMREDAVAKDFNGNFVFEYSDY